MDILCYALLAGLLFCVGTLAELCRSGRSPAPPAPRKSEWCEEPGLVSVTAFVSAREAKP